MNEEREDMTESGPVGFDRPVEVDDPKRPGVRLSELRRGPMERRLNGQDPAWLKWMVIGLLVLLLMALAIRALGVWGIVIGIGLAIVGLLAGIFVRLGRH